MLRDETATMLRGNNPNSGTYISGAIVQLIIDGGDNVISPPTASGQTTGDDAILFTSRIGVGVPVFLGERGRFSVYCNFSDYSDKLYVRIFNTSDLATAEYYGQTSLYSLAVGDGVQSGDRWFIVDAHGLIRTDIPLNPNGDYVAFANAAGPYAGYEGSPVMLDASGTTDPDTDINTLVYLWDLDGNGIFDDAVGITANYVWPDNCNVNIAVKALNTQSGTAGIAFSTVVIQNVAPQIIQVADQTAVVNTEFYVSTTYYDPGTADTHTVNVNWGDSNIQSNIPVSNGLIALPHIYGDEGIYNVEITIYDDDGASSSIMFSVTVNKTSNTPVMILPRISRSDGILITWEARQGYHYIIWFTDNILIDFDSANPNWNLVDVVDSDSYNDIGDSDGYDNTINTSDDRLHPSFVNARYYAVFEVAD